MIDDLVPRGRIRANTDRLAPYLDGLTAIRLGLRDPEEVEAERDDVPGLAEAFGPLPRRARSSAARSTSTSRSTGRSRCSSPTAGSVAGCRRGTATCSSTSSRTSRPRTCCCCGSSPSPGLEVFGVGDDDQVIYGHAGADPAFLIDFEQLFPVPPRTRSRSTTAARSGWWTRPRHCSGTTTSASRRRSGPARPPTRMPARSSCSGIRPRAARVELVDVVQGWIAEGVPTTEIAVLTRVNSLLLAPHVALIEAGVPVSSNVRADMLDRTGVRAALGLPPAGFDARPAPPGRPAGGAAAAEPRLPAVDLQVAATTDVDRRAPRDRRPDRRRQGRRQGRGARGRPRRRGRGGARPHDARSPPGHRRRHRARGRDDVARRLEGWPERLAARRSRRAHPGRRPPSRAGHVRAVAPRGARGVALERGRGHALDGPPGQGHGVGPGRRRRRERRPAAAPPGRGRGGGAAGAPRRDHPVPAPGRGARRCVTTVGVPRRARRQRAPGAPPAPPRRTSRRCPKAKGKKPPEGTAARARSRRSSGRGGAEGLAVGAEPGRRRARVHRRVERGAPGDRRSPGRRPRRSCSRSTASGRRSWTSTATRSSRCWTRCPTSDRLSR